MSKLKTQTTGTKRVKTKTQLTHLTELGPKILRT